MRRSRVVIICLSIYHLLMAAFVMTGCQGAEKEERGTTPEIEECAYTWNEMECPPGSIYDVVAFSPRDIWLSLVRELVHPYVFRYDGSLWEERAQKQIDHMSAAGKGTIWGIGCEETPSVFCYQEGWKTERDFPTNIFTFTDIAATTENHVWVTGIDASYKGVVLFYDGGEWAVSYSVEAWLTHVSAIDDTHVWVAGRDRQEKDVIYYYDGRRWKMLNDDHGPQGINDLCAVDSRHVWAATATGVYLYDGQGWVSHLKEKTVDLPAPLEEESYTVFSGIRALDASHVWAIGLYQVPAGSSAGEEEALDTSLRYAVFFFNGKSWTRQYESEKPISSLYARDPENVWAFGPHSLLHGIRQDVK